MRQCLFEGEGLWERGLMVFEDGVGISA